MTSQEARGLGPLMNSEVHVTSAPEMEFHADIRGWMAPNRLLDISPEVHNFLNLRGSRDPLFARESSYSSRSSADPENLGFSLTYLETGVK